MEIIGAKRMATAKNKSASRQVIVTTSFRGVYYGTLSGPNATECVLDNARMVIRWGTTDGVDQLAATGPTQDSKLGAVAPRVFIVGVTSIVDCTEAAVAEWAKQ